MFVRTTMLSTHVHCIGVGDPLATGIQVPAGTCELMNIANCIKYQMQHVYITGLNCSLFPSHKTGI